jgi:hypothetical protein
MGSAQKVISANPSIGFVDYMLEIRQACKMHRGLSLSTKRWKSMHYWPFPLLFKILAASDHLTALLVLIPVIKVTFSLSDSDRCNMAV